MIPSIGLLGSIQNPWTDILWQYGKVKVAPAAARFRHFSENKTNFSDASPQISV